MSLEGRLEDMGLSDIFQIISLSKRSGVLTLIRKEGTGRLVFNQGQILFASSDMRSRLGYTLVKKGIITNDDLEYALRTQKGRGSKKPIGTLLIEMNALDIEIFERELKLHIVSVVRDLLGWETGSFYFELSSTMDPTVVSNTGFNTEMLLLEAMRLQDEEEKDKKDDGQSGQASVPAASSPGASGKPSQAQAAQPSSSQSARERKDLNLLVHMIAELSKPSSHSELTLMILRFASEIMDRAIIFLVRKDDVVGLGQFGLDLPEGEEQGFIRSIKIPLSDPSVFGEVTQKKTVYKGPLLQSGPHKDFIGQLGDNWPKEVFVAPVVCEGEAVAVLYGDNITRNAAIDETEGLEAFIKVAEVAFTKALLERKIQKANLSG